MGRAEAEHRHLGLGANGAVRIDGTRHTVLHLAGEHDHFGWSAEEILRQHPELRPEQVYAALASFYDHHETMIARMAEIAEQARKGAAGQSLSRSELLNGCLDRDASSSKAHQHGP